MDRKTKVGLWTSAEVLSKESGNKEKIKKTKAQRNEEEFEGRKGGLEKEEPYLVVTWRVPGC